MVMVMMMVMMMMMIMTFVSVEQRPGCGEHIFIDKPPARHRPRCMLASFGDIETVKSQAIARLIDGDYPLVNIQKAIEHGHRAIEIVDFPIKNGEFP